MTASATPGLAAGSCRSYQYGCVGGGYAATAASTGNSWAWRYYGEQGAGGIGTPSGPHNCTLYVAWRLQQNGMGNPGRSWGDASKWGASLGYNRTPAVGSVAWWQSGNHVAYVEEVSADGSRVRVSADNYVTTGSGGYTDSGWVSVASVTGFLHPHDQPVPPVDNGGGGISEGSFISNQGRVYRVVGGAPLYVSSWASVGGEQPTTAASDARFAALRTYPSDGTFVNTGPGYVYVFAGGAPLYVGSWDAVGGTQPSTRIDQFVIDASHDQATPLGHVRTYPADGTFVNTGPGYVYRFAGGAPLYVSSWDAVGGSQPSTRVDQAVLDASDSVAAPHGHVRTVPANGTYVNTGPGYVYRFAGGAPLYVSSWDAVGGPQPSTQIDQLVIDASDNRAVPLGHVNTYPADGTFVDTSPGYVYEFVGGAPLYLSTWDAVGGPQPSTRIDQAVLDTSNNQAAPHGHVRTYPADGTFVTASTQTFRFAGGAALHITSWAPFGGAQPATVIDRAPLDQAQSTSAPWGHVRPRPAAGTSLTMMPSGRTASLDASGNCTSTQPTNAPIMVNDDSYRCPTPGATPNQTSSVSSPAATAACKARITALSGAVSRANAQVAKAAKALKAAKRAKVPARVKAAKRNLGTAKKQAATASTQLAAAQVSGC